MSACRSKKIYAVFILIFIFAAALRFYYLELRPFHHDEGINALFTLRLINDGEYKYNPDNFHGPLLYYLTFIPLSLFGLKSSVFQINNPSFSDISFRLIPALLGSVIVFLVLSLKKWLGRYGTAAAMILLAISPSCLYYSRYNIHEIYFVIFTLLTFICGYHYAISRKNIYIYLSMVNLAFLFAVKETAIVTCAVWAVALLITSAINTFSAGMEPVKPATRNFGYEFARKIISPVPATGAIITLITLIMMFAFTDRFALKAQHSWALSLVTKGVSLITFFILFSFLFKRLRNKTIHVVCASFLFLIVISIFFSSFFTYPKGIALFFVAFEKWLSTGTALSPHTKPFYYFFDIMFSYESPILIFGFLAMIFSVRKNDPVTTFVVAWALLSMVIYSAIPYKTPWLVLNIILPFALLSGKFIQSLLESLKTVINRIVFAVLSFFIIARMAYTAINISFINYDNDACKIVYVQTYRNAKELVKRTFELTKKYNGHSTKLNIITPDYWPLPWCFRNLTHAVWYGKMIENPDAPLIIADSKQGKHLESKLKKRYKKEHYCLRPGVAITIYYQIQE